MSSTAERVATFLAEAKARGDVPGAGWRQDTTPPTLKCGCTASATRQPDGVPSCPIHNCIEVVPRPDLTDRVACCGDCGKMVLSSFNLPFFKYMGPGSRQATEMCRCGFHRDAHTDEVRARNPYMKCHEFNPNPDGNLTDEHYDGCRGWD